ncbi:MAG: glycosyltransferase family 2 protein, partial [Bacteroidota bacterium]
MQLSIVIPLMNEEESLRPLHEWIDRVLREAVISYEIVFVDDGSTDRSWSQIEQLRATYPKQIRAIKFRRNYGKSAALATGFQYALGDVICTMDADLQDSPDELPELYRLISKEGYDLISGWKKKRHDPWTKTLPSKLFNWVARKVSHIPLHDFNCGLKAYKAEVAKSINVYGDLHRWMPILAKWEGYTRIGEKIVDHRARQFGDSKFGAKRLISGFLDLLTLFFVGRFNKKPMHFFGTLGILFLVTGIACLAYLAIAKIIFHVTGISDRPLFFLGLLASILGMQLFL